MVRPCNSPHTITFFVAKTTFGNHSTLLSSKSQKKTLRISSGMGGALSNSSSTPEDQEMALSKAKQIVSSNSVVVFSKTYCGYCSSVRKLFSKLNTSYKLLELDVEKDGGEIQSALAQWTGQRTVPNVFIGGKHIGGCDDVTAMHKAGKLAPLLNEVGAIAKTSSEL